VVFFTLNFGIEVEGRKSTATIVRTGRIQPVQGCNIRIWIIKGQMIAAVVGLLWVIIIGGCVASPVEQALHLLEGWGGGFGRLQIKHGKIGLGEYTYIYVLAYYSWLGHSPGDGPGRNASTSYVMVRTQSQLHRDLIRMLSNQLDSIADAGDSSEWNQWRSELAGEIQKMKNDEGRVPWKDAVPRNIAESLEPFREGLEQSYSPLTNPFELSLPVRRGLFSFSAR
jgi:hypothetical protein